MSRRPGTAQRDETAWTIDRPGWTSRPMRRPCPGSRRSCAGRTPPGHRVERRVRRAVSPRRPDRPALAHLSRPGARRLDRRRRHQAQDRLRHRPARTVGIDLVAMSVNDCLCTGGRTAVVPRLRGHEPRRSGADDRRIGQGHQRRLHRGRVRPGRRRDGDPARFLSARRIRPGRLLRRRRRAETHASTAGTSAPATRSSAWPARACIPTATAWSRKIVFDHAGLKPETFVAELGRPSADELLEPDADLRPGRQDRLPALPGQADRPRHRPHHRRRPDRQPARGSCPTAVPSASSADRGPSPRSSPGCNAWARSTSAEMDRVFNMGIGLVVIVAEHYAEAIVRYLNARRKLPAWIIGEVVAGDRSSSGTKTIPPLDAHDRSTRIKHVRFGVPSNDSGNDSSIGCPDEESCGPFLTRGCWSTFAWDVIGRTERILTTPEFLAIPCRGSNSW